METPAIAIVQSTRTTFGHVIFFRIVQKKLSKKVIEREVAASKAALKAHLEGAKIHKIVLKCFEEELKKYNP